MLLAHYMKSVPYLIISLWVDMCVCDSGIVSCPKQSGIEMQISGLVGEVRTSNGRAVIVQSYKDVIVNCSKIPELTSTKNLSLQMSLNDRDIRNDLTSWSNITAWKKDEHHPWQRKQVNCSLGDTERPVCSANLFLSHVSDHNSSKCYEQPNNVTCQIGDWYSDAAKARSYKCVAQDINPVYEFSMYLTANQSWTSCDATMRSERINPPEYSNITCMNSKCLRKMRQYSFSLGK